MEVDVSIVRIRKNPVSEVQLFRGTLHLVLDLDLILDSLQQGDDGLCRLENVRSCIPGVVVTLFTDQSTRAVVDLLSEAGIPWPNHLLSESGVNMHHRTLTGELTADPGYREWFDFHHETSNHPGAMKAIGVEYLDIPVFTEREGRKGRSSDARINRVFQLDSTGLSGVVRLLLSYVSGGGQWRLLKAC